MAISQRKKVYDLLILDDYVPRPFSSFRIAEFNYLLKELPDSIILSSVTNFWYVKLLSIVAKYLPGAAKGFKKIFRALDMKIIALGYLRDHPGNWNRISYIDGPDPEVQGRMAYMLFLNNAHKFLDYLEKNDIDFTFTLYPGGGFCLHDEASDKKLARVFGSKNFKKVIATQRITGEYVVEKGFCDASRVVSIFGGVLPSDYFASLDEKKRCPADKQTIDVCFVANKYTAGGVDKGYDLFVAAAHRLIAAHQALRFHVVGDFDENDIDVSALAGTIFFYGKRPSSFFRSFYLGMEIILSPNRPFVLAPGAFDGFPTGCCVEVGLCGVAVFCTDPLQLNSEFTSDEDIVIVSDQVSEIVAALSAYVDDIERLYGLSRRVQQRFREVFDIDRQMEPRINAIKNCRASVEAVARQAARSL